MNDLKIEKGDIVKVHSGLMKVNWVEEGRLGATDLDNTLSGMVYSVEEATLVRKGVDNYFRSVFQGMSNEELRSTLTEERRARTVLPKKKERAQRKKDLTGSLLKDLSDEEIEELRELVRTKKGR